MSPALRPSDLQTRSVSLPDREASLAFTSRPQSRHHFPAWTALTPLGSLCDLGLCCPRRPHASVTQPVSLAQSSWLLGFGASSTAGSMTWCFLEQPRHPVFHLTLVWFLCLGVRLVLARHSGPRFLLQVLHALCPTSSSAVTRAAVSSAHHILQRGF